MASNSWNQLYDEAVSGVVAGVPAATYEVKVVASRALPASRLIFLDLGIQVGPQAGKISQVNLYVPEPGNQGAGFHFRRKIAGFVDDLADVFASMPEGDIEKALTILAESLVGRSVLAEVGLVDVGEYAGKNDLIRTSRLDGEVAAAPVAAPAAAVVVEEAAPVAEATSSEVPF